MLFFALWWVKEMLERWRSDLEELRDPQTEWIPRLCLIGLWLFTMLIAFFVIGFLIKMALLAISDLRAVL
jgi:hypothetical protein